MINNFRYIIQNLSFIIARLNINLKNMLLFLNTFTTYYVNFYDFYNLTLIKEISTLMMKNLALTKSNYLFIFISIFFIFKLKIEMINLFVISVYNQ